MPLVDLVAQAEDLGSYDAYGVLWIFRRPACQLDLSLRYEIAVDRFVAVVEDEGTRVSRMARTRVEAVTEAMDEYLVRLRARRRMLRLAQR